jgi:hypothetical protein
MCQIILTAHINESENQEMSNKKLCRCRIHLTAYFFIFLRAIKQDCLENQPHTFLFLEFMGKCHKTHSQDI